jgi:hypothetical protein
VFWTAKIHIFSHAESAESYEAQSDEKLLLDSFLRVLRILREI